MKRIEKIIYKCDYCGHEHGDEEWMKIHEECCALNPKNQPCSMCSNMILGMGCSKRVPMENIGGNVLCFYYKEGIPLNPFEHMININGNLPLNNVKGDNDNDDDSDPFV